MLLLALDTSTPAVTVAVGEAGDPGGSGSSAVILAERTEVANNRHGEALAPLVAEVLAAAGASAGDLGALAVGLGPGPFTGLRVGLVTAGALADALAVPAYGVCSLDALAARHRGAGELVVATDARRKELYWARYDATSARVDGPAVQRPAELAGALAGGVRLAGAGVLLYRDAFEAVGLSVDVTDPYPQAAALVELVADRARRAEPGDDLTPLYLRRPDAVPPAAPQDGDAGMTAESAPAPVIRGMVWQDVDAVMDLERELFGREAWSASLFWSELAQTDSRSYLVAELDGRLVGYAGLCAYRHEAFVQTMAVEPSLWGHGLGARLLTELMEEAARRGNDEVLLEVRIDNLRAQALYERFGFVTIGRRRGYYQPSGTDALVMRASGVRERYST